jgi:hypothetical protein
MYDVRKEFNKDTDILKKIEILEMKISITPNKRLS